MSDFLMTSEITESRAFIKSFVKEIKVKPGKATVYYTLPTPPDSPIGGGDAAEVALHGPVRSSVHVGGCGKPCFKLANVKNGNRKAIIPPAPEKTGSCFVALYLRGHVTHPALYFLRLGCLY